MNKNRLLAIRWTWWPDPKDDYQSFIDGKTFLTKEKEYYGESSYEVEYRDGLWWATPDSFGLILDPDYPIRKVWATDVHTFSENGLFPSPTLVIRCGKQLKKSLVILTISAQEQNQDQNPDT